MSQLHDLGLAVAFGGLHLPPALLLRWAGGRLIAAARPHLALKPSRPVRWSGRHGLPDALVSAVHSGAVEVAVLEARTPRPQIAEVGLTDVELSDDERKHAAELDAAVEVYRAEKAEAERRASLVTAVQEHTTQLPVLVLQTRHATDTTREWFAPGDAAITKDDNEFSWVLHQLLADEDGTLSGPDISRVATLLQQARAYRDGATSGEYPIVREAVSA